MKMNDAQAAVLEHLGEALPVTARAMFGGIGLYSDGLFFALIDGERLYLKVDDVNRPDFEALGLGPFLPFGDPAKPMQYYPMPDDAMDDVAALRDWADGALGAARRAAAKKAAKGRGRNSG